MTLCRKLISTLVFSSSCAVADPASTMTEPFSTQHDPYIWLEQVEGEQALNWVESQNQRTLEQLQNAPVYKDLYQKAEAIVNVEERIPFGTLRNGEVYNFWQDADHVRGLIRKTSWQSYQTSSPEWQTVLDIDQLARDEGKNWVYKGSECFTVATDAGGKHYLCMLALSDGGKDAAVRREFNITTGQWVDGGFSLPEAKSNVAWITPDQLLVATDWGSDGTTLSESGYPTEIRLWQRGTPLNDAKPVLQADKKDLGAFPMAFRLSTDEHLAAVTVSENFWDSRVHVYPQSAGEGIQLPLPAQHTLAGMFEGYLVFVTQQDWQPEPATHTGQARVYPAGSLLAFDLGNFLKNGKLPDVKTLFVPHERQAIQARGVSVTADAILVPVTDNVRGQLYTITRGETGWNLTQADVPENGTVRVAFADEEESLALIQYEGFLTPDSLMSYHPETDAVQTLKSLPVQFEASDLVVEQFHATSTDGTQIPYFVVHKKDIPLDGSTPTLLYGYGGFQVSMRPFYSGLNGKLWLERGGAFVLANIRGGGEFGPSWHQAGLKTERQRIYDDFIAVAEQLIEKKITSQKHLGIMGGSNGGLLMGVMLTQRPELWNAVVIQVPLLDMLRYHLLLAGASWVGEYGSPEVAEEREWLEHMSPYHNVDPTQDYPEPFFLTSTKDDRVHPAHARKMAKRFEATGKPFLYYENIDGGHSAAANLQETAKRKALEFTYLTEKLMATDRSEQ